MIRRLVLNDHKVGDETYKSLTDSESKVSVSAVSVGCETRPPRTAGISMVVAGTLASRQAVGRPDAIHGVPLPLSHLVKENRYRLAVSPLSMTTRLTYWNM